jgi:hypothetical protein
MEQHELLDLNSVVGTKLTEEGVDVLTRGMVVCANVRTSLRHLLQHSSPEDYKKYREIKYPTGEGSDTEGSRLSATRFLFDASRDLLCDYYVPSRILTGGPEDSDAEDDQEDDD